MGSLIGILSTVILVSTVCTLIFAVGAYIVSRKNRDGVGVMDETTIPGNDIKDQFPQSTQNTSANLFRRVQPQNSGAGVTREASSEDDDYQWI